MTLDDLHTALEGLSTERLERLVDRLERDPDIEVTVGAWVPRCPMVIAGFDPTCSEGNQPEHRFAAVWDRFARSEQKFRIPLRFAGRPARRSDVQLLLRRANAVLANRSARDRSRHDRQQQARRAHRHGWSRT
jgi:hypothetical protein